MLTTKEKVQSVLAGLGLAFILALFVNAVENAVNMPDVYVSYSTGECVKVLNYVEEDQYSCENLPSKYNQVWVK